MGVSQPRRERGRTLIERDPDQLVWVLLARESREAGAEGDEQVNYQLGDLREFVAGIGGRVEREVPESNVSSFKRRRVMLPDGTYGYRVVRPDWEATMTALRRGEANALAGVDIDRLTRDPRILEDLIDAVELYGIYVASMTGNIDLSTDAGISAARGLVNQRNTESRNTSRRVSDGKRRAAARGQHNGGRMRPFGWRKDRVTINKREAAHIRRELPRIRAGVSPLTLANEWNKRRIPTVTGVPWRAGTVRNMFLRPRMCGQAVYRGEVVKDEQGKPVRGRWEPILTDDEHAEVVRAWGPSGPESHSRLGGKGRGYRTNHLLSPFVRCGKCNARMIGSSRRDQRTKELVEIYRCPTKGQGGCAGIARSAEPVDAYVTALVLAEHEKIQSRKFEDLPPWPKQKELDDAEDRIAESTREYEAGRYSAERYFPSLARMEAQVAELRREARRYERRRDSRRAVVANLRKEWDKPDFTIEQKQAAIAKSLVAVVIGPANKGGRFHPDQITPIFRDDA
ncbi:recombinase family protein [Amycolatopsis benzoatilytica]|uniref:recombinase family protein n=1 Tax=Amycolatopsis benzoatilytica TaxID=346045 RepID=UPI00036EFEF8|nr:recombinase family protein [Amycolatopsis benzoatilytica]